MNPSQSFESLNEEELEAIAGSSRGSSSAKPSPLRTVCYDPPPAPEVCQQQRANRQR